MIGSKPHAPSAGSWSRFRARAAGAAVIVHALLAGTIGMAGESQPVSDDAFDSIRAQFPADHVKPDRVTVRQVAVSPLLAGEVSAEEISLAFGNRQTEIFYILRPKNHREALQPIVYGPPATGFGQRLRNTMAAMALDPPAVAVLRSGRALVFPIWDGSFERFSGGRPRDWQPELFRSRIQAWHQTLAVLLDYLQTREKDIDAQRVGFLGYSVGASYLAPSALALEGRIRAAVLVSGGLINSGDAWPAMVDSANFVARVRIPVLMINGRNDTFYPLDPTLTTMFNLLGTRGAEKQQIIYEGSGHADLSLDLLARDVDSWFDKYLGPAR